MDDEEYVDHGVRPQPDLQHEGILREWLNADESLQEFEYILRGYKKNFETDEWEYQKGEEWLNDKGVNKVMGSIISGVNEIVFLTDLSDDEINRDTYAFRVKLIKMFAMNSNTFELNLDSYGGMIVHNASRMVFNSSKRARKFQTARILGSSTQVQQIEQRIERSEQPQRKKFSIPLPGFGRRE